MYYYTSLCTYLSAYIYCIVGKKNISFFITYFFSLLCDANGMATASTVSVCATHQFFCIVVTLCEHKMQASWKEFLLFFLCHVRLWFFESYTPESQSKNRADENERLIYATIHNSQTWDMIHFKIYFFIYADQTKCCVVPMLNSFVAHTSTCTRIYTSLSCSHTFTGVYYV